MKDYSTFPFFSLRVGRDPKEIPSGIPKKHIKASTVWEDCPKLWWFGDSWLFVNRLISLICWSQSSGTAGPRSLKLKLRWVASFRRHLLLHEILSMAVPCPLTQTLRLFLASCEKYLAMLGSPANTSMIHVGTFISLSSQLAVAAAPRHYRSSKGLLDQRVTIKELQVPEDQPASLCTWTACTCPECHSIFL